MVISMLIINYINNNCRMSCRKKNWSEEEQQLLFKLHQEYGNKWSIIATKMADKEDGNIKNKFYSTLRKGLRKINKFIVNIKKRSNPVKFKAFKTIEQLFLTKMIAVVDENYDEKYEVKARALELAPCIDFIMTVIQKRIVELAFDAEEYLKPQKKQYDSEQELLRDILEFNKNCKKRKGKKKQIKDKQDSQANSGQEHQNEQDSIIEPPKVNNSKASAPHVSPQAEIYDQRSRQTKTIVLSPVEEVRAKTFKVEELPVFNSSFVPVVQKVQNQDSKQKKVSGFGASMQSMFAGKAEDFFRIIQDNNNQLMQSNNLSMSGSWNYDLANSCDIARRHSGFFTHPSPLGGETPLMFDVNNMTKCREVSDVNMYEDKNQVSADLFASGKIPIKEDNYISMVDHVPQYNQDNFNFLVKSSDMLKSAELSGKTSIQTVDTGSPSPYAQNGDRINQFLSQITRPNCLSSNADMLIKDYSFGVEMDRLQGKEAQNKISSKGEGSSFT